jgi:RNA polymerase sigma-70 factor (ECF subfamily)
MNRWREPLDRVFREEATRLTASLVRLLGDFDLAEELVSEAVVEAIEHWPHDGVPDRPGAWLLTTARRKGLDRLRREAKYREKLALLAATPDPPQEPDDRLRLIFTCCHPTLSREAQIALTLRAVIGFTTEEIARACLVPEPTIAKRITRAKHKITSANIPYRIPASADLHARLHEAFGVIYLIFNEGYLSTAGASPIRRDLALDAEWLAGLLVQLMPHEPEAMALLALIRLHLARWPSRLDAEGHLVLLRDQDRGLWNQRMIRDAIRLIERAAACSKPGPYQVEASIAAVHCESPSWAETDWRQLLALYTALLKFDPSPVVALNRAVALRQVAGPAEALSALEPLGSALEQYHLFHAVRASLLNDLGRPAEANQANARARELTRNPAEQTLIDERLQAPAPSTA